MISKELLSEVLDRPIIKIQKADKHTKEMLLELSEYCKEN